MSVDESVAMRLKVESVSLERGGRVLFAPLSLEMSSGEALTILGPNGAGKSSLLRAITGFLPVSGGRFALDGGDPDLSLAEQAHYLGHADALKGALTAHENLAFWAGVLGAPADRRTNESALSRIGLAHVMDFPVRALSAGQKRRVALARLLVARRPIWLLDEPTTALDMSAQALFAGVMQEHLEGGGLILAATHAPLGLASTRIVQLAPSASIAA